jgi:hypothetical protein
LDRLLVVRNHHLREHHVALVEICSTRSACR